MATTTRHAWGPILMALAITGACAKSRSGTTKAEVEVKRFKLDSLQDILTRDGVTVDKKITADGGGAIRVQVDRPRVVDLFEIEGLDIHNARLVYRAKLRTQVPKGKVFLEMWCRIPGQGEFFSRALQHALTGTTEWTSQQTPFVLQAGQKPDLVRLSVAVGGPGVVWVDQVQLLRAPL